VPCRGRRPFGSSAATDAAATAAVYTRTCCHVRVQDAPSPEGVGEGARNGVRGTIFSGVLFSPALPFGTLSPPPPFLRYGALRHPPLS